MSYIFDGFTLKNPIKIPIEDYTSLLAVGQDYLVYGTVRSSKFKVFKYDSN